MNNNLLEIDAKKVLERFAELTGKKQRAVYRNGLRKAARILANETRKELRKIVGAKINSRNKWNGKTLGSGIKYKIDKEGTEAKIHIMGDFRLKFFEKGTVKRFIRKNKANRGSMKANYFFRASKANKEKEVFASLDRLISESINRVANK